jgi:hypothetical protein
MVSYFILAIFFKLIVGFFMFLNPNILPKNKFYGYKITYIVLFVVYLIVFFAGKMIYKKILGKVR